MVGQAFREGQVIDRPLHGVCLYHSDGLFACFFQEIKRFKGQVCGSGVGRRCAEAPLHAAVTVLSLAAPRHRAQASGGCRGHGPAFSLVRGHCVMTRGLHVGLLPLAVRGEQPPQFWGSAPQGS